MVISRTTALDDLAFQTNLAALSAAVETAAERGTGFTTAAAELQHLTQAARRTAALLEKASSPELGPSSD